MISRIGDECSAMKRIFILCMVVVLPLLFCMKEEFGGIGIEVPTGEGKVTKEEPYTIVSVFKGGAGESAGLKDGDVIISIDGRNLVGLEYEYIVQNLLRGKVGTTVILEIERKIDGKKTKMLYKVPRIKIVMQD
jgi:C-terminal processing protease CtpA/Prc